ncbi:MULTISPECIES: hypothetical protein [Paraburkholderia]|uniref:hypothetical protein n=1 Tax=Paraburkholderia TaxID=1822464 RepID=UPI0022532F9A|nr:MULTISPECIES: hypothetical protein [Paraburkholderia]MCX4163592.1 hypothetical protein [Paraburkholderia megapolitana]MDN7159087.1 hypothetical protein [Paraburkholderia sp. CHISQ3]MDQ6496134.1 hypothetical protein [Paraburkholderia megapolitana]
MLEYREKLELEAWACRCDRCGLRIQLGEPGWDGKLSIDWHEGPASPFGNGATVSIDLCQNCARDTLGKWLRIAEPDILPIARSLPASALKGIVQHAGAPAPIDAMSMTAPSPGHNRDQTLLDDYLEELRRVLSAAIALSGNTQTAIDWFHNNGLAVFSGKTAQELMAEGRTTDLLRYIESLQAGFTG